jgi:hypothetical protein
LVPLRAQLGGAPVSRDGGASAAVSERLSAEQAVDVLHGSEGTLRAMGLADDFREILDVLPSDWTDLELDLRVDESQYLEAATFMVTCNAQPYSNHDWHWRILVAHQFGHAAAAPAVLTSLKNLDQAGIRGELVLREMRAGRVETINTWGRPESVRQEFWRLRAQ